MTGELEEGVWKEGGKGRPIGRSCWSPPSSSFERGGGRAEWRIGIRFVTLPFHFLLLLPLLLAEFRTARLLPWKRRRKRGTDGRTRVRSSFPYFLFWKQCQTQGGRGTQQWVLRVSHAHTKIDFEIFGRCKRLPIIASSRSNFWLFKYIFFCLVLSAVVIQFSHTFRSQKR